MVSQVADRLAASSTTATVELSIAERHLHEELHSMRRLGNQLACAHVSVSAHTAVESAPANGTRRVYAGANDVQTNRTTWGCSKYDGSV